MTTNTNPIDDDDVSADLNGGKFLKQSDFPDGAVHVFTIVSAAKKTFDAKGDKPAERKWVVEFEGGRCLSLNSTNLGLLAKWFGKKPSAWIGKEVTVYVDESVQFAGRLTGGLRLRRPTAADRQASDDIPF